MQNMQGKIAKIKVKRSFDADWQMGICIAVFYFCNVMNLFAKKCIGSAVGEYLGLAIQLMMMLFIWLNLNNILRRAGRKFILAESAACIFFCISCMIGDVDYGILLYNMLWLVGMCIPIGFIAASMDKELLYRILECISKPLIVICIGIYLWEFILFPTGNVLYDMSTSYALAFPVIVLCNSIFEKISIVNIAWVGVALLLNLMYGCRGSTVCILAFVAIKILFGLKSRSVKQYMFLLIMMALAGGLIAFFFLKDYIFAVISGGKLDAFRSIETILNKGLLYGSGRGELYRYFGGLIVDSPMLGKGICGGWPDSGNYPHNIVLEFLVSFGVVAGGLLTVASAIIVIKALKKKAGKEKNLFLIYLALNIQLLVSGTFLQSASFFICMLLGINMIRNGSLLEK